MRQSALTRRSFIKVAAATTAALSASTAAVGNFVKADPALAASDTSEEIVATSCRACIQNCAVKAHVRNGRVISIEGDSIDPMSRGRICAKGFAGVTALYNPNRMKYPMKRVGERGGNKWERITWKEAIDTIADAIWEMDQKGDSMQLLTTTGGGGNPQFFSAIRFAMVNESNFFEPGCAQCYLPRNHAQQAINGTVDNSIMDSNGEEVYLEGDYQKMQALVLWGADPAQAGPASCGRAVANLRARGVKTVVIDPRMTPDASKADVWQQIRPGTDVALMLAWIRYILENEAYDKEFVLKWTNLPYLINEETMMLYKADELGIGSADEYVVWDKTTNAPAPLPFPWNDELDVQLDGEFEIDGKKSRTGFRALKESAEEWTLEKAAEVCWLDADRIEAAIKIFIEGSPHAGVNLGVATDQYEQSAQAAQGATFLDVLMGNIQRPGNLTQKRSSAFPLTYMVHPFDMFCHPKLSVPVEKKKQRLGYIEHKGLGFWFASHIPTVREALETGQPYQPKIWIDRSGNKPAMLGGANQFLEAAKKFELIVHMYMYPTAMSTEMADILLPTAEWLETAYAAQRMDIMLIRQDIVHLYEAVDETMAWSWLAFAMAERGHERFKMACDPEIASLEGAPISAYWKTYDEYKEYLAGFVGSAINNPNFTWKDFQAKGHFQWIDSDVYRDTYYNYQQINEETGKPNGFATWSGKCEVYLEQFVKLGRTGLVYGRSDIDEMPPASVDYSPVLKYVEPDESPLDDTEYPYVLTEGRLPMYHHGTLRNAPYNREMYPVPRTLLNPQTAEEIGVKEGDWVLLESRRGQTHGLVHITQDVQYKVVFQERFWNPELLDSDDPKRAWQEMNINVLTRNDGPFNPEYGTYTLRGFTVKISKSEKPEGIFMEPKDFAVWMPQPSDDTGGGYAVYDA